MITAYVSLGSNLGDRAGNLLLAVRGLLEANFVIKRLSAIYETDAVEVGNQDRYLNMIAELEVPSITPEQMLARMLRIEYLLGRRRKYPGAPRTIDIDLLMFGDEIKHTDFVTLPHPRMHKRRFVLVPFDEIAPEVVHPALKTPIAGLLAQLTDKAYVKRYSVIEKADAAA